MKLNYNVNGEERICRMAARLFNRYGIRSITMDEIASRLGISKKTIYCFYEDKNELVQRIYAPVLKQATKQCSELVTNAANAVEEVMGCWQLLRKALLLFQEEVLHDMEKYHAAMFGEFEVFRKQFLRGLVCKNIERGKRELLYRPDANEEIIACYQVALVGRNLLGNNRPAQWSQVVINEQLMLQYLNGLCTVKGLKMIAKYKKQVTG